MQTCKDKAKPKVTMYHKKFSAMLHLWMGALNNGIHRFSSLGEEKERQMKLDSKVAHSDFLGEPIKVRCEEH